MINEINILHKCHCGDFACHAGKKSAGLFCVVSYHHKIIVELGEYRFNSFTDFLVCPRRRTQVFLIQPIWNFKRDIDRFKEIILNLSTEISLVTKHGAIMILPTFIPAKSLQIPRILAKFSLKLRISSMIILSSLTTTNLLIICELYNFFIYKYLEF